VIFPRLFADNYSTEIAWPFSFNNTFGQTAPTIQRRSLAKKAHNSCRGQAPCRGAPGSDFIGVKIRRSVADPGPRAQADLSGGLPPPTGLRVNYTARGGWTAGSARYDWRVVAGLLNTLRDLPLPFRSHADLALRGSTEEKHLIIEQ